MKKALAISSFLIFTTLASSAQSLNKLWASDTVLKVPESVYFDEKGQRLYVANIEGKGPWEKDGKGSIALLTLSGKVLNPEWIKGLHAPKGMTSFQDILVVADVDSVVFIFVPKGEVVKKIHIENAKALNDVTSDKRGNIYVSDSRTGKIHRIGAQKLDVTTLVEGLKGPNGVLFVGKTLYFVDAGSFYKLGKDNEKVLIAEGLEGGVDGIEQVDESSFLISCWSGAVWHVKTDGSKKLLLDTRDAKINSADIGYDPKKRIVYVPTFWMNNVVAYELKD